MIIEARGDVVRLEGALDKNLWPTIEAAVNLLLRAHSPGIIIDGSGLTGISPEGAKTFRDAMNYIENFSARIVVAGLSEPIMDTVRAMPGIRSRLPVTASVDEARASLTLAGRPAGGASSSVLTGGILVPLLRADNPEASTVLACRLARAEDRKTPLHLAYMLEVPRHQPLNAPLPEEEGAARGVIQAAEEIAHREGQTAKSHVVRTREAGEEIVTQAAQLGVSKIVLAYTPSADPSDESMKRVADIVMERAPCEVILSRVTPETA